jgi:hypothetical protein
VRLAEMVVEVEDVLPCPPEAAWALLTDVERTAGLGPENVRSTWDSGDRGVGARFTGENRREGIGEWSVPCTVVAWEPGRRFAWVTGDPGSPSAAALLR